MMRVIAALTAEDQRSRQLRVPELAVRTLAAGREDKPRLFQIGDQLSDLARHTGETATRRCVHPVSILPRDRMRDITSERLALVKTSGISWQ